MRVALEDFARFMANNKHQGTCGDDTLCTASVDCHESKLRNATHRNQKSSAPHTFFLNVKNLTLCSVLLDERRKEEMFVRDETIKKITRREPQRRKKLVKTRAHHKKMFSSHSSVKQSGDSRSKNSEKTNLDQGTMKLFK